MNSNLLQGFYLRDLLVDPVKGHVVGHAGYVHLQPKAMEVLLVLASNSGTLVTREQLLNDVWGSGHGSPEALSRAVSEIRHALDDHADDPDYIQTLPKRGYRLIVEARPADAHTTSVVIGNRGGAAAADVGLIENLKQRGVLETAIAYLILGWLLIQIADIVFTQLLIPAWAGTFVTALVIAGFPIAIILSWFLEFRDGRAILHELSPKAALRRRFSRTYFSVIGALAIAAIFVYVYDRNVGLPAAQTVEITESTLLPPVLHNSIAVLPFLNLDGSEDTQIFSNGLSDDLITRLSRVPGLLVSSRGDAFTLSPNSASKVVRERLRVALYLEGSVQIANDKLRIIVQMIDSATGFHVMSRRFDRPREDFFDLRNEITELTVANVRVALPQDTQIVSELLAEETSLDAYVLYRRGVDASHEPINSENVNKALAFYDSSLAVDPDYAAAHAGKCALYVEAYAILLADGFIDYAQSSCAKALDLNPNLDVVHTALGDLYRTTGRYIRATAAYTEALNINPRSVTALIGMGTTYMLQMNREDAEANFTRAIGLQPGNWQAYNALGKFLYQSGRFAEAADEYIKVVALDDKNMIGFSNLGTAFLLLGRFEEAAAALENAIAIDPQSNGFGSLGLVNYYLGQSAEAVRYFRQAIALSPKDHLHWSNLGDALWSAGDMDGSQEAFEAAEEHVKSALAVNPNDPNGQMDLAWINSMLDRNAEARALIDRARELAPYDPYVHYIDGLIYLRGDNTEAALEALDRAAEQGYSVKMMSAEPHLASLRGNPRFRAIVESN